MCITSAENLFRWKFLPLVLYAGCILLSFSCAPAAASTAANHVVTVNQYYEDDASPQNKERTTSEPQNNIWAVLVAGSNEYYNYRHQADVSHAYQILIRNGVPADQIITMMYDDIANNTENPTPGIIINRPNGTNVYEGVVIDYRGAEVTPQNFIKVLLGQEGDGTKKVLRSGPTSHVIINFVDHGGPGLIAFPSDELHARELKNTLKKMYHQKLYGKLVFYLEACESGSMFKNLLPPHWNIFATTAANGQESSYACYFDMERNTYLGDVYSVNWMENADQTDLDQETLQNQFVIVRNETNTSHVMEFGDNRLKTLPVADFLGYSGTPLILPEVELDAAVSAEDVVPSIIEKKLAQTQQSAERRALKSELKRLYKMRKLVTAKMMSIIEEVTGHGHNLIPAETHDDTSSAEELYHQVVDSRYEISNYDCYERVARYFSRNCFSIAKNPYVTRKLYLLVNMCELGMDSQKIVKAMTNTCHHRGIVGIH